MAYSSIVKPGDYFNTKLYSGTGSSQAVTGVGFQPDWIWFKCRTQVQNHNLFDAIRGSNKIIQSSTTNAEATSTALLTSFDSDGFTLNTDGGVNGSGQTYASWNWLANGAGSSNTDGTITSTVSVNTTAGFSIVKYTGDGTNTATIGHGLGATPSMVIMKPLSYVGAWWITQKNLSTDNVLEFNTNAQVSYSSFGGGGLRQSQYTSSIITGGAGSSNSNLWNQSGQDYIAYCFAEKTGYSKFGYYTGNGNADGSFIFTGFKPAFVIIKQSSAVRDWIMVDNKRDPDNVVSNRLFPNNTDAQNTNNDMLDFTSNGFKIRNTNTTANASNGTYIYMAFSEEPLVANSGSNGVPATAR